MRARVAAFDWSRTPLGPREHWPQSLQTAVDLVLSSAFPMILMWGDDLIQIYNDGYAVILDGRHPDALGRPTHEVWPEVRQINEPLYQGVRRGETFFFEDQLYPLTRHGFVEEAYFTLCYSPVREGGEVGGVLVTVTETTAQVLGARRLNTLREHAEALAGVQTVTDLRELVRTFQPGPDVPFIELFMKEAGPLPDALLSVTPSGEPRRLDWTTQGQPPRPALAVPVDGGGEGEASGALVLGLNPRVPLDGAYRDFLGSYARQAAAALVRLRSGEQAELNRRLEEERAALGAFAAFTEAVGTELDVMTLIGRAITLLGEGYGVQAMYHGRKGELFRAQVWSPDVPPELLARSRQGFTLAYPDVAQAVRERQMVFVDDWETPAHGVEESAVYGAVAFLPFFEGDEVVGVLAMGARGHTHWTGREQGVLRAVGRSLSLALERTQQTRRLDEERAALGAFAAFTKRVGTETDGLALVRRAMVVLGEVRVGGTFSYFEREEDRWTLRAWSEGTRPEVVGANAVLPLDTPVLADALRTRRVVYREDWDPGREGMRGSEDYGAAGLYPLVVGGEVRGVFGAGLQGRREWRARDRTLFEAVCSSLTLALERAEQTRRLAEEREALAAFARFSELAADTSDVGTLARRAAEVLHTTLNVRSAVYFEQEEGLWRARHVSGARIPELERRLYEGVPESAPSFALPAARREPMFFEPWNAAADSLPDAGPYGAVARYPLFPPDHPVGILGMASTAAPNWTEREKAVFRAVGDSFRLALERAARVGQIERQRERLADLNAELGNFITRTAHNLEAPARRLGHLLDPGRPLDPRVLEGLPPYDPALLRDEVTRLSSAARDLRQLSRLEEQELTRELLPLGELFAEVRAEVSGTPRGEGVHWLIEPLPIVRGNRALLRQALGVLMTFTLSETRGARSVTVGSREVEGEVQVTVEDDGLGLTSEEAATLFDLLVRTDQAVPLLEGSGLVQVRRILARHGGWVWAEAQRTSGKVVLAFPRDEAVNELEALFRQDRPGR